MIDTERLGDVFLVRMATGENRLGRTLLDGLHRALDDVERHDGPAAVVTTGTDRFYSNGLDLEGMAGAGPDEAAATMSRLHGVLARVLAFPAVTVAAVNGHAFAAGAMLAAAHDVVVMREDRGWWCLPEVDLATGQPLTRGMTALLRDRLPVRALHEACVTGRRYTALAAVAAGIVDEARPAAEVVPRGVEVAQDLADRHRPTVAALKEGLHEGALAALWADARSGS